MGLFTTLFGDGFKKHRDRGDRLRAEGELGLARAEYETALQAGAKRAEIAVEVAAVRKALGEVKGELAAHNRKKAGQLSQDGLLPEAIEALHFTLELLEDETQAQEVRAELVALMQQLREQESRQAVATTSAEGDEFSGETFRERLEIFLGGLEDDELADGYEEMSDPFLEAVLRLQDGKAEEACGVFETLLAEGEDRPLLHLELGRALLFLSKTERLGEAVGHLRRWVQGHPRDHQAITQLAEALRQAGEPDEATRLLEQVASEAPGESTALQHLAEHLLLLQRFEDAAEAAEEGLEYRPRSAELKQIMGLALHGLGRGGDAAKVLEAVLRERWRVNPETDEIEFDRPTATVLVRTYLADEKLGQAERALDLLQALLRGAPEAELPAIHLAEGQALLQLGRQEEARRKLETALAEAPADSEVAARARKLIEPAA